MSAVDVEDDYNIQEAWERACGAFAQTTKVDLTTSPQFTVDEVLDQIRIKQDEGDEKNKKFKTAKDVIGKTLTLITVLGGIAAQGASMVFAPSSLCFNAVSYLIATGAKYKRIFSSLAELFRRISDVLERCKIYMRLPADAVDISLRKIINEELGSAANWIVWLCWWNVNLRCEQLWDLSHRRPAKERSSKPEMELRRSMPRLTSCSPSRGRETRTMRRSGS
ncbi:unnamed protein product [Aspergillus oryzae RIB40]|uniref:DNA, SC001 n=1 Tax=Aspergillus oryzae (strain ATCC 42149 / RIB 40) TaxID=510516 RepID=Q2UPE5_ASPOR|nr:unnamed protein product [Aspergillus oryzae RIB40]BAE56570.1 unnamed protein product [Aspergillus oryzae RIB40]